MSSWSIFHHDQGSGIDTLGIASVYSEKAQEAADWIVKGRRKSCDSPSKRGMVLKLISRGFQNHQEPSELARKWSRRSQPRFLKHCRRGAFSIIWARDLRHPSFGASWFWWQGACSMATGGWRQIVMPMARGDRKEKERGREEIDARDRRKNKGKKWWAHMAPIWLVLFFF